MLIAIDFDGTCCTHAYPEIGEDIGAIPVLKLLHDAGHKLVLWTMRSEKPHDDALQWLRSRGVTIESEKVFFDEQSDWSRSKKLFANLYIDDAALGIPLAQNESGRSHVDWAKTKAMLEDANIITRGIKFRYAVGIPDADGGYGMTHGPFDLMIDAMNRTAKPETGSILLEFRDSGNGRPLLEWDGEKWVGAV